MAEVATAAASTPSGRYSHPIFRGGTGGGSRCSLSIRTVCKWNEQMICGKKKAVLQPRRHAWPLTAAAAARTTRVAAVRSSGNNGSSNSRQPQPPGVVTFSSSISTDMPLYEPPGAGVRRPPPLPRFFFRYVPWLISERFSFQVSFDEYIYDRPRVFSAMFPDKSRSKRLNNDEWRIQMLPIQFLFASVNPVVVMRLLHKSNGKQYPPVVPKHATSVLELEATRWELQGLEGVDLPPHFALNVQGVLYPDRSSSRSRLRGHLEMGISLILPPMLKLVPEDVLKGVADAVLKRLVEKMKQEVDVGLTSDYANFRREKVKNRGAPAQPPATSTLS